MILSFVSLVLIFLDQLLKGYINNNFTYGEVRPFIPHILSFTKITNTGAAWSIFEGKINFLFFLSILVIIILVYIIYKEKDKPKLFQIGIMLILSGTIGNAIDRGLHKYVIDMFKLELFDFPIFNLADTYITVGVILLIIYIIYFEGDD